MSADLATLHQAEPAPSLQRLLRDRARLESALWVAKCVSWELDAQSGAFAASGQFEEVFGLPAEAVQSFADLAHPEERAALQAAWEAILQGAPTAELVHRTPRGAWVHCYVLAERGGEGRLLCVSGLSKDISDRKQAQQAFSVLLGEARLQLRRRGQLIAEINELLGVEVAPSPEMTGPAPVAGDEEDGFLTLTRQLQHLLGRVAGTDAALARAISGLVEARAREQAANQAKSEFVANMSHELRTPLHAVIGYAEILEEDAARKGDAVALADSGRIVRAGRHLLGLINQVLDLGKIEAGKLEPQLGPVNLAELLAEVIDTVRPLVEKNANRLELALAEPLGVLATDRRLVAQCLLNLLSNAAKFTEGGVIRLEAACDGRLARICVSDTGIGIAPEALERLFQPFVQADASTTRKYGGTGLGLALSRRFARLLGGDVTVASTLGQGSAFTLTFQAGCS